VHQLVEFLLSLSPGMNDGVHILKAMKMGWFRLESWNGVDNEYFLSHLLFIFSTHDSLIEDGSIRMAFANIVRTVYSVYVRIKVKKFYRADELHKLGADIQLILNDLQSLFNLSVVRTPDKRNMEEEFQFKDAAPVRARSKFHKSEASASAKAEAANAAAQDISKSKGKRERTEDVNHGQKITGNSKLQEEDDDEDEDGEGSEDEHEAEGVFTINVGVNELPAATLGGHQTRTHKCHALTMIPKHLRRLGSLDVGSSRIFETLHRLVKAFTYRSNRAKLEAVERQVIQNSVSARYAPKPLSSIKARLFREQHSSSGRNVNTETECLVSDDEEEPTPTQFLHEGTGQKSFLFLYIQCSQPYLYFIFYENGSD
jgi:hypothetical protein